MLNRYKDYGYFWVPFVGCHIGGILGCWIYRLCIENHWPETYDLPHSNESESTNYNKGNALNRIRPF